jgi:hypothetical protein
MVAITPTAKNRYFQMLPAIESRMQTSVSLEPLNDWEKTHNLYKFYVEAAREKGKVEMPNLVPGDRPIISEREAESIFDEALGRSKRRGIEGGVNPAIISISCTNELKGT